jgi:hypothetical protein
MGLFSSARVRLMKERKRLQLMQKKPNSAGLNPVPAPFRSSAGGGRRAYDSSLSHLLGQRASSPFLDVTDCDLFPKKNSLNFCQAVPEPPGGILRML